MLHAVNLMCNIEQGPRDPSCRRLKSVSVFGLLMQEISKYGRCGVVNNGEKMTSCICWACKVGHRGYTKPLLKMWCMTECHEQPSNFSNLFVVAEITGEECGYVVDGWCM